jgi:hypothetical protein
MHATLPTDLIVNHSITLDNPNIWLALQHLEDAPYAVFSSALLRLDLFLRTLLLKNLTQ